MCLRFETVKPDRTLFLYFFIAGFLYLYYEYLSPVAVDLFGQRFGWGNDRFVTGKDQEPAEFLLAAGFFLFVLINRSRLWPSGGEA